MKMRKRPERRKTTRKKDAARRPPDRPSSSSSFVVEEVDRDRLDEIERLWRVYSAEQSTLVWNWVAPNEENTARWRKATQKHFDEGDTVFVAVEKSSGRWVGILFAAEDEHGPGHRIKRIGYVSQVYVVPEWRKKGVMRALLSAAEGWFRARGLTHEGLYVMSDNEAAVEAWERLGFASMWDFLVREIPKR